MELNVVLKIYDNGEIASIVTKAAYRALYKEEMSSTAAYAGPCWRYSTEPEIYKAVFTDVVSNYTPEELMTHIVHEIARATRTFVKVEMDLIDLDGTTIHRFTPDKEYMAHLRDLTIWGYVYFACDISYPCGYQQLDFPVFFNFPDARLYASLKNLELFYLDPQLDWRHWTSEKGVDSQYDAIVWACATPNLETVFKGIRYAVMPGPKVDRPQFSQWWHASSAPRKPGT